MSMTHKQRFLNALNRQPVDRLAWGDTLWPETTERYVAEGQLKPGEDPVLHFDMSWRGAGWLDSTADLDFKDQILDQTDEWKLILNGNGASLKQWSHHSGTPEHVDFKVKERPAWEALIKPHLLKVDRRRIDFAQYHALRDQAHKEQRAFVWGGVAPFEQMHPVCGHEYMLMGMVDDPDWVLDMVMTYARFTILHLDALFAEENLPDAFWFYEDMGFKERPFMSPAMYRDLIQPGHKMLFDYAHSKGRKVIVHSCGCVEKLVPGLVEAGMDCLQAMEVKAGMDVRRLAAEFGDRLSFIGNLDIRIIGSNDRKAIDEEIESKILPILKCGSGFIVHSDHSVPPEVDHDTLVYFFDRASRMAQRVWPELSAT